MILMIALSGQIISTNATAEDWRHWRGNHRNDTTSEASGWEPGKGWPGRELWHFQVGAGCTSPIVVKENLYVTGWSNNKDSLWCFDAKSGNILWKQSYSSPKYGRHSIGDKGFYGGPSASPEYDSNTQYVYTLGIDGDLICWNTARGGQRIWGLNLYDRYGVGRRPEVKTRKRNHHRDYGYTAAPLVYGKWVLVEVGNDEANVMAFDKLTGRRLWTSEYKGPAGHTGGLVPLTVEGIPCVAVLTMNDLVVMRLDEGHTGKTIATYEWKTDFANNIPTPAVKDDLVLITSKYNHKTMCKLQITLNGAKEVWTQPVASGICSPIIHKDYVYFANRGFWCLDFNTGKEIFQGGKVGDAGSCILTSDDRVIVWANDGDLMLVDTAKRANNQYKQLAAKPHVLSEMAWPHVVLADGLLVCKDKKGNIKTFTVQ